MELENIKAIEETPTEKVKDIDSIETDLSKSEVNPTEPVKPDEPETNEGEEHAGDTEPVKTVKLGIVSNCVKLNVRKEPRRDAEVIGTLKFLTEVTIEKEDPTGLFYKVHSELFGLDGYCMKQFISVQ